MRQNVAPMIVVLDKISLRETHSKSLPSLCADARDRDRGHTVILGAEALKKGNLDVLAFPDFFPNQGGLPIQVDGQIIGGIAASGAKSEIDEAVAQAALDAFFGKK